jgi:hypothetical protein
VNLDQVVAQFSKDWEWISFLARYCAGGNIDKPICRDFMWWGIAAAAVLAVFVLWWIAGRISRAYRNWAHGRELAKVADEETMRKHVWSGYSPEAMASSDQRARKTRNPA